MVVFLIIILLLVCIYAAKKAAEASNRVIVFKGVEYQTKKPFDYKSSYSINKVDQQPN